MTNKEKVQEIFNNIQAYTNELEDLNVDMSKIFEFACNRAEQYIDYTEEDEEKELNEQTISIPIKLIFAKEIWQDFCRLPGMNEWAVNEGYYSSDDYVDISIRNAKQLGIM